MSRVYFHSPSATAELRGSERAHLAFVAAGPALAAWGLERHQDLDWQAEIIGLIPEAQDRGHGENWLHQSLREAQAENSRNKAMYAARKPGGPWPPTTYEAKHRLDSSLKLALNGRISEAVFEVAGRRLGVVDVALNTALLCGSRPIQLAAKIDGWCETHAWVDGPDREWFAEIIDEGLAAGIYRRGIWYADTSDGPKDRWSSQGWEEVTAHLRSRDDEPCVMSYSVCDQFPNRHTANWTPPPMPDGWIPKYWEPDAWAAQTPEEQAEYYDEHASDLWYDLPDDERWAGAMEGLKAAKPWAQITPDNLGTVTFGPGVTVYDLLATDRDERVAAHFDAALEDEDLGVAAPPEADPLNEGS